MNHLLHENSSRVKYDLNCDLGEQSTLEDCIKVNQIMDYISRCNISCGAHAGNEAVMEQTLLDAKKRQLKVGAHPGYEDKKNFGRISLSLTVDETLNSIQKQLTFFERKCQQKDIEIDHIKFHGALYHDLEKNDELREPVLDFIANKYPQLKMVGIAGGKIISSAIARKHPVLREGFMDRRYQSNGLLVPRSQAGAMIEDLDEAANQAKWLLTGKPIQADNGNWIQPQIETLCVHGDNPDALNIIKNLQQKLQE